MMGEGELGLYYYPDQEKKDFDEALLEWCKEEAREEGRTEGINIGKSEQQKDIIISLNDQHISLEVIAKSAKISINKVKQIINDYLKDKK